MSRILVVDDDHELAGLLAVELQRWGHDAELATHGSEALQRLQRARFDVVLVDWHMPVMDGATFLGEYRRATASACRGSGTSWCRSTARPAVRWPWGWRSTWRMPPALV